MSIVREVTIGDCRLIQGDCREILPTLPRVDAVVSDPPYGLGEMLAGGSKGEWSKLFQQAPEWDRQVVSDLVPMLNGAGRDLIVWGGNYYPFPPVRGWLLWDKMQEHSSAHAEMAWTNLDIPVRTFRYARAQLATEGKEHPTQKPLPLMAWCLGFLPKAQTILDPFAGSGTTGVACVRLGKAFIGIEREPAYFDVMVRRIEEAHRQADLFVAKPAPKPPVQEALL